MTARSAGIITTTSAEELPLEAAKEQKTGRVLTVLKRRVPHRLGRASPAST